ncbi:hypothetical protein I312_101468 [Cryptococcus bacillisporus CA1280]|uniref:Unplaced genomic scaffold supercont1.11, whole genome shotgun sequence n=1 Tax=Cryptococcus bacillisporus CA1280 TaxID=1296109 RepID=A0A0D0VJH6_CRYGA|nr:solute carrier family 35, member C2 [Cryptococcus bacillisporus CA1280]
MDRDMETIAGPSRPGYDPVPIQGTSLDAPPGYSQNEHMYTAEGSGYQPRKLSFSGVPTFERDGTSQNGVNHSHEGHRHATLAMKKALWWRNAIVTGIFILSWYGFATLLSLYNKWMFSPQYYNFQYPLFVTACHMVVQFALAAVIRLIWADRFRPKERPTRRDYLTKILPTAASTGGDIGLSNLSLKTITLSLYTMCKSSTLIFVLIFAFAFRLEAYSLRLISVISLISFGVFCMVFNTTAVSIPGILMVFSASALGGLRWALTELVMHKKAMGLSNPFATIFWLAPLMAVTLAIVSMIVEGWFGIMGSEFFKGWRAIETGGVIVLPGTLAFAMVASEYFVIQRAGVVPLSIAGIFKEVSTISISAWVFGDQLTTFNIIGVVITITGIALYSFHKYQKSMSSTVELDAEGKPVATDDSVEPLMAASDTRHSTVGNRESYEHAPMAPTTNDVPLSYLSSSAGHSSHNVSLTSMEMRERGEEEINKAKDDFEGWDRPEGWSGDEEELEELGEDEIARQREEREGQKHKQGKWGEWLDKQM